MDLQKMSSPDNPDSDSPKPSTDTFAGDSTSDTNVSPAETNETSSGVPGSAGSTNAPETSGDAPEPAKPAVNNGGGTMPPDAAPAGSTFRPESQAAPGSAAPTPAPTWAGDSAGPTMPASVMSGGPKPHKKGLIIGLVAGLIVIVLGGSAAAAYYGYYVPNKPENVLKTALVNSFSADKVKSEHFDGKVSITDKSSNMTLGGTFQGGATNDGKFDIKADIDAVVTKVSVELLSTDGSSIYAKLSGLDGLPQLLNADTSGLGQVYAPMISAINGQWITINQSMLSQLGVSADASSFKMSSGDYQKLGDAYKQHQFMSVKSKQASEKISNMDSYHYTVVINKTELKNFAAAIKDAKLDSLKITSEQLTSFDKSVDGIDFNKYPVDLWVAKSTKLIDQVKFNFSDDSGTASIRFTIDDYNKPVTVQKPAGAKSLLEVLSQLYSSPDSQQLLQSVQNDNGISL